MKRLPFLSRVQLIVLYILPVILAWLYLSYTFNARIDKIGLQLKPTCVLKFEHDGHLVQGVCDDYLQEKQFSDEDPATVENSTDIDTSAHQNKILKYWQLQAENTHAESATQKIEFSLLSKFFNRHKETNELNEACIKYKQKSICEVANIYSDVDEKLFSIFLFNIMAVFFMVLLPFFMMAEYLANSQRVKLDFERRMTACKNNWWLKFILALIMSIGWIYIINPLGRGASTFYQFFIAVGLETENTLPIFIKTEAMSPVIAGFFGWYLHLIGYVFTKVIHHDVISPRVYNLLFRKFIVVYGLGLILPTTGVLDEEISYSFFMFLIGLFPLATMSMLLDAASKISAKNNQNTGSLTALPGISRWQILRLEEEGVDSMASLANIQHQTIKENLQFIENLVLFWMDIARLYTIVGHDGYESLKMHCQTATEFILEIQNKNFVNDINKIEGVGTANEIARLLKSTFPDLTNLESRSYSADKA